jgi:hypothetical protein
VSEAPKEKVLVYTGPSLDADSIREQIPEAIIKGPIQQGDFGAPDSKSRPASKCRFDDRHHGQKTCQQLVKRYLSNSCYAQRYACKFRTMRNV